ncbi:PAS domain-containing protein [Bacteroidales bacterium OttesenSCG-928-A17]|nr:PAS domain-containing protein [Bacteroidales bacterium OttesenSCG-928-A17]
MKTYSFRSFIRLFWTLLFALLTGALFALQHFWIAGVCLFFLLIFSIRLASFQRRSIKDMHRLINAIEFSEFNISFQNSDFKGLAPELIPAMESAIDVFNKKQRNREAELNFYETLLNRIDFAIIVIDKSGKIEWINKAALDILGKPQPRKLYDLAKVSLNLPEELDTLIPRETKIIRFTREKRDFQMAVTALYFSLEEKNLKLISLKNIQSVLEENEIEAWKKLIRVLTHEIMNSLSPIISLSETFSEPDQEAVEFMPQAMQTIHRRSKGLIEFVHNYQKLTRIPAPVKVNFSAGELLSDISSLLHSEGYLFSYTLSDESIQFHADRGQIEQVLINLIKNACESSDDKDLLDVKVEISKNDYNKILIRITDNGQGILPEILDKIFVPFYTTKPQGSGIGLSICRQIISLHDGTISVESEVDKGSCFSILL